MKMFMKCISVIAIFLQLFVMHSLLADTGSEAYTYGDSVHLDGNKVIIDRRFLDEIKRNPTAEEWYKNYWEFLYFIEKGDELAISIGIDVLVNVKEHRDDYDDHIGVKNLAVALSMRDDILDIICNKSQKTQEAIIGYYIKHQGDYVSGYDAPWLVKWCE